MLMLRAPAPQARALDLDLGQLVSSSSKASSRMSALSRF